MTRLSIVIPTLNEAATIHDALSALVPLRARGVEVLVADGGSGDDTLARAEGLCDRALIAPRGRGAQMTAGAAAARGDIFLFLHADTRLPEEADLHILAQLPGTHAWGRFDVRIAGRHALLPV